MSAPQDSGTQAPTAKSLALPINFVGCGAFLLALAAAALVRVFIPDEVMQRPSAPLSTAGSYMMGAYVFGWLAWLFVYLRTPGSLALTLTGAVLCAIGLAAQTSTIFIQGDLALLPAYGGLGALLALLCAHAVVLWQRG